MPPLEIAADHLRSFGAQWTQNGGRLSRTPPSSSTQLGKLIDEAVGGALATLLGDIEIVRPSSTHLLPQEADCVEVGECRVVGGIRPQNFDVAYRPDGVRFVFDGKTLNDTASVRKNYQNMINDLGTEATTVHTRFPYGIVAFLVAIPAPCLASPQRDALIGTLERLTNRPSPIDPPHLAEVSCLMVWDPETGAIDGKCPGPKSPLRIETFSRQVEDVYVARYKGLPPHA